MEKYDFELDMASENSRSLIIQYIKPDSHVLEFGPANGRMTEYMKGALGCHVDIVEIDGTAGAEAAAFAEQACIGGDAGNIENYIWYERLQQERYDYILFADVLEHLHEPEVVLSRCRNLLTENGSVLVSVPNIAHNSILLELLQNDFPYKSLGILDNTHVHFFSEKSFREMAERVGYDVLEERATLSKVGENEFAPDYSTVSRAMAREIKCRGLGDVYQYIFHLQRRKAEPVILNRNIERLAKYWCQCYVTEAAGASERLPEPKVFTRYLAAEAGRRITVSFDLSLLQSAVEGIHFSPLNTNCVLRILETVYCYADGSEKPCRFEANGFPTENQAYIFTTEQPDLQLELPQSGVQGLRIVYELLYFDDECIGYLEHSLLSTMRHCLQERDDAIQARQTVVTEKQAVVAEKQAAVAEMQAVVAEKQAVVAEMQAAQDTLERQSRDCEWLWQRLGESLREQPGRSHLIACSYWIGSRLRGLKRFFKGN